MKGIKLANVFVLLLLTAALALPLAGTAFAQTTAPPAPPSSPQAGPGRGQAGEWLQDLGLNDDQKAQIKSLRQKGREQVQAARNDSSLTPEQQKAKIKDIRKNTHTQVWSVLTPEQQQKAKEMRRERQQRRHGR